MILFAIGVVTGTILSFELGLLWPGFMERWGEVFGFAFAIEGLAFFCRGDLHRDLRLRLGPAFAAGTPAERDPGRHLGRRRLGFGDRGQRLDEQPPGVRPRPQRRGHRRAAARGAVQPQPLARGGPHVPGGPDRRLGPGRLGLRRRLAARQARRLPPRGPRRAARGPCPRGAGPADRRRLGGAHRRQRAADEARRHRGARPTRRRAPA